MSTGRRRHIREATVVLDSAGGGVLLELAILIPLLLLFVGGIVDLSTVIRESNVLIEASRHGARSGGASAGASALPSYWCRPESVHYEVPCSDVAGFAPEDGALEDAVARTCEYLALAFGTAQEWEVRADKQVISDEDPVLGLDDGRFVELALAVRHREGAPSRCLICSIPLFRDLVLSGASTFAMQVRCAGGP